jgi:dTDP-glucose 4,6-dehydratase
MRVLVTGGAGFVGGHLVRALLRTSPEVRVTSLDVRESSDSDGLDPHRYRFVRGDVADRKDMEALFAQGFDVVVHCAALTPSAGSRWDGPALVRTNVVGTQVLLEAALRRGARRFVQVSTDEVYGPAPPGVGFSEESPPNPQGPYAASRAAADLLCLGYRRMYGLPAVVVRIPSVYGPAQPIHRFVPLVITRALRGEAIPIYGDGRQERDWLYVEDLVEALLRVLSHPDPRPVLNVATGKTASYLAVARTVLRIVGRPTSLVEFVTDRSVECRRFALDPSRARAYLGWRPAVDLEEGLERTVAWYGAHRAWWEVCTDGERRVRAVRG